ncbi:Hsp70 family protein [Actinoplanes sp. LDG1-06]|uniref:Hsp70 family protein n=1 Tax=Paractinoplanes ovalisporus TaxID=2810368 RepID=A0ABS2ASD5_9ACTN|nr:Hsp70 family protein [Actinoplanes ovalisporus]MBM2622782.1 Hsp70 family protein [Actinoplanes ovalisporus]
MDSSRYLPSVVCLDEDGHLLTGRDAAQEAAIYPDRAELQPKRALVSDTETRLGDRDISTVEIAAATLRRVADEAVRRFGGPPEKVALTHPAAWTATEIDRLAQAAALAGLPTPTFVPEPVAAAIHYATSAGATPIPAGAHIAVYDLGGGTFDTAVLRRTGDGFEICGPPGGDPDFGGDDVSEALREVVGEQVRHDAPEEWERLWSDESTKGQQRRASQLTYLTQAKESLSGRTVVVVPVHAADAQVRITRAELETAIERQLAPTVDELVRTVEDAGLRVDDLAAVYLTGGSSRIPRVSELVAARIGRLPVAEGDPKAVVCQGALTAITRGATAPESEPVTAPSSPEPGRAATPSSSGPARVDASLSAESGRAATPPSSGPARVDGPLSAESGRAATPPPSDAARVDAPTAGDGTASAPRPAPKKGLRGRLGGTRRRVVLVSSVAALLVAAATATAVAATSRNGGSSADPTPAPVVTTTTPEPATTTPETDLWGRAVEPTPDTTTPEPDPTTPEPEPTTPEPTTPEPEESSARDNLSPSQQDLYDKISKSSIDEETCEEWSPGAAGVEAGIQCDGDPSLDHKVGYLQFKTLSAMNSYLRGEAAGVTDQGSCRDGDPSVGTWNSNGDTVGELICYRYDGGDKFRIVWSHGDAMVVISITDGSPTKAGDWWYESGWMLAS